MAACMSERVSGYFAAVWIILACAPAARAQAPPASGNELRIPLRQQQWAGDLDGMVKRRVIHALVPYSHMLYFVDLGGAQRHPGIIAGS